MRESTCCLAGNKTHVGHDPDKTPVLMYCFKSRGFKCSWCCLDWGQSFSLRGSIAACVLIIAVKCNKSDCCEVGFRKFSRCVECIHCFVLSGGALCGVYLPPAWQYMDSGISGGRTCVPGFPDTACPDLCLKQGPIPASQLENGDCWRHYAQNHSLVVRRMPVRAPCTVGIDSSKNN